VNNEIKKQELDQRNFEAEQNLAGFFDLLLKIDKRINSQLYHEKQPHKENND